MEPKQPPTKVSPKNPPSRYRWPILLVLLTLLVRLPAIVHPKPIDDEGGYAVIANELLHGRSLYIDVVERKPPLLFWTYAAIFKIFGVYRWPPLHLAATAWILLTMWGLYAVAKTLFDRNTGLAAALFLHDRHHSEPVSEPGIQRRSDDEPSHRVGLLGGIPTINRALSSGVDPQWSIALLRLFHQTAGRRRRHPLGNLPVVAVLSRRPPLERVPFIRAGVHSDRQLFHNTRSVRPDPAPSRYSGGDLLLDRVGP